MDRTRDNYETSISDTRLPQIINWIRKGISNDSQTKNIRILHGNSDIVLVNLFVDRLFLDNTDENVIRSVINYILDINAHVPFRSAESFGPVTSGAFAESLVNLSQLPLSRVYIELDKLDFDKFFNFINQSSSQTKEIDLNYLRWYLGELKTSFKTLSIKDKDIIKRSTRLNPQELFFKVASNSGHFLLMWATIEATKFCIVHKHSSPKIKPNEFLQLIEQYVVTPVRLCHKLSRLLYSSFIWMLDRLSQERIKISFVAKQLTVNSLVDQFFKANAQIIEKWFDRHRLNMAKVSLYIDNPEDSLHHAHSKLQHDLYKRIDRINLQSDDERLVYNRDRTLLSIDNDTLNQNIELFLISAKHLSDIPLIKGITKMMKQGVILPNLRLIKLILTNLEGRYLSTLNSVETPYELKGDESSIVEYLNACIEYDKISNMRPFIDMLQTKSIKSLYETYLDSRDPLLVKKIDSSKIERWLTTWSDMEEPEVGCSINGRIELIVPTCLNIISQKPLIERHKLLRHTDWLLGQNLVSESLITGNPLNQRMKNFHILVRLLRDDIPTIPLTYLQAHSKDLKWHQSMYRYIKELGLVEQLRTVDDSMDIIQYKAAKYYKCHKDLNKAIEISDDLIMKSPRSEYKVLGSLLQIKGRKLSATKSYSDIVSSLSDLSSVTRYEFRLKFLRFLLKSNVRGFNEWNSELSNIQEFVELDRSIDKEETNLKQWMPIIGRVQEDSKVKTLRQFARRIDQQLQSSIISNNKPSNFLNTLFDVHLRLIMSGSQLDGAQYRQWTLESVITLVRLIGSHHSDISQENINLLISEEFIKLTLHSWVPIRDSLIALALKHETLVDDSRKALITILERMASRYPQCLLYLVISNRLTANGDIFNSPRVKKTQKSSVKPSNRSKTNLENTSHYDDQMDIIQDGHSNLNGNLDRLEKTFWNRLYKRLIKSNSFHGRWKDTVSQTEQMVTEIRKFGFLRGDILRKMCDKLPRGLYDFFRQFLRFCLSTDNLDKKALIKECELQLDLLVYNAKTTISILMQNAGSDKDRQKLTKYDLWFVKTFSTNLKEMEYRLNLLLSKRPLEQMQASQMLKLIRSITSLLSLSRKSLNEKNQKFSYTLYTEKISPILSKFKDTSIPIPDCHMTTKAYANDLVTVNSVSSTITILSSKTLPKKIRFLGSDGVTRTFLLKAQENLHLDSYIMSLFDCFNKVLMSDKILQNDCRIRTYSVTPFGPMCALIQWIESSTLCSHIRNWHQTRNGTAKMKSLYAETCKDLCPPNTSKKLHKNCHLPANANHLDIYHQRLWVQTKHLNHPLSCQRPSLATSTNFRASFDPSIFVSVIESLINDGHPRDLIANYIWQSSYNSQDHWRKQKSFTNSCALMSMIGYIIGLGDRHLDNILFDKGTGELIHVDFSICFELGRRLPIPEMVPFRLTPNLIYAMGFGGLEGRYTEISRNVMKLMREKRQTILHFLDPIHCWFLLPNKFGEPTCLGASHKNGYQLNSKSVAELLDLEYQYQSGRIDQKRTSKDGIRIKNHASGTNQSTCLPVAGPSWRREPPVHSHQLDLHSQESINFIDRGDMGSSDDTYLTDLLTMNDPLIRNRKEIEPIRPITKSPEERGPMAIFTYELKANEKVSRSLTKQDIDIIYKRIHDKLSGTDELLREFINKPDIGGGRRRLSSSTTIHYYNDSFDETNGILNNVVENSSDDLIHLDLVQSVDEQVSALIGQATSMKNYSKMFEGWMAWI